MKKKQFSLLHCSTCEPLQQKALSLHVCSATFWSVSRRRPLRFVLLHLVAFYCTYMCVNCERHNSFNRPIVRSFFQGRLSRNWTISLSVALLFRDLNAPRDWFSLTCVGRCRATALYQPIYRPTCSYTRVGQDRRKKYADVVLRAAGGPARML